MCESLKTSSATKKLQNVTLWLSSEKHLSLNLVFFHKWFSLDSDNRLAFKNSNYRGSCNVLNQTVNDLFNVGIGGT